MATNSSSSTTYTPFIMILLVVAAFLIGSLSTKVQYLEKSGTQAQTTSTAQVSPAAQQPPTAPQVTLDVIKKLFNDKNIFLGDKNSKNLLVEVADPSCPYCHIAAGHNSKLNKEVGPRFTLVADGGTYVAPVPEMKKLVDQGKAAFVWIYSPGHGNGEMGTKAFYCANEKGKFWEVHDKLMGNAGYDLLNNTVKNDKTKSGELANFLSDVFDVAEMKKCLDSGKYDTKIQEDVATAGSLGVNGTPGFFINTTSFAGAYSWTDMQSAVQ